MPFGLLMLTPYEFWHLCVCKYFKVVPVTLELGSTMRNKALSYKMSCVKRTFKHLVRLLASSRKSPLAAKI